MALPVENLAKAFPFYETTMEFRLVSRADTPHKSAIIARDGIQLGLVENGTPLRRMTVSSPSITSTKLLLN